MTADELRLLSSLLDEGLAVPVAKRDAWLRGLGGEAARLATTLRELLAKQASQETADLVDRAPAFAPVGELGPGETVGPYRLLSELGHGGMGAVWLAERVDGHPKRKVALKLPYLSWAPGLVERFLRESQILASLEHPRIARLYDAGLDDRGRPYMALEYVEGESLDAFCRSRSLPLKARLELLLQVAEAVAYAHSRLVVHRDLKPSNIMVTAEGQVRLLDFGVAKLLEGERAVETRLTQLAGRALTPDYASPEQILGEPIGTASDVYSLGVVAFEVLAGARPYRLKRATAAELEEAIVALEPPRASDVAAAPALKNALRGDLDAILGKALKKNPADRYATADALAQDWRRFLCNEPVMAQPDTMAYRVGRFARRHRMPLAAGGLVAVALVAGTGVALWQAQRAAGERDRALTMASRNEAATEFLNMLLTRVARGGQGFTPDQVLTRSEQLVESEFKDRADHRALVLSMLGINLQTLGLPQQGLPLLERALQAARQSGDQSLIDKVAAQHAFALAWSGSGPEEAKASLRAIASRASAEPEMRAEAHHYLASIASRESDAKAALENASEALRWHRESSRPSPRFEVSLLASLGGAYTLDGRAAEGERQFEAALDKLETLGQAHSPQAIALTVNFAVLSQRAGDVRKSLELSERALAASARDAPDSPKSPYAVIARATALEYLGRFEEADAGYAEGAALSMKLENKAAAWSATLGRAWVRIAQGKPDEAARFIDEADQLMSPKPVGYSALTRGALALERGDMPGAIAGFEAAVGKRQLHHDTIMGLLGLSEAHLRLGRPAEAMAEAQEALAVADRLRGGKPASFRSALAQLAIARAQHAQGDAASARRSVGQALEQLRASVDPAHPAIAQAQEMANTIVSAQ